SAAPDGSRLEANGTPRRSRSFADDVLRRCGAPDSCRPRARPGPLSFLGAHANPDSLPPTAAGSRQTGLPGGHDPLQMTYLGAAELPTLADPARDRGLSPF